MCVAVPGKVVEINNGMGKIDFLGVSRQISLELISDIKIDDYVMVHAGYAIEKIKKSDAIEILQIIEEINKTNE